MNGSGWPLGYCLCALLLLNGCGRSVATGPEIGAISGTRAVSTATRVTALPSAGIPAALVAPTRWAGDWAAFADRLRGEGFAVERAAEASAPFLRAIGTWLHLSGGALARPARLAVYTYADPALAADDATRVQPDISVRWAEPDGNVRTISYAWVAPPHFFRQGGVLVIYAGTDPAVLRLLTYLLGPQFVGREE